MRIFKTSKGSSKRGKSGGGDGIIKRWITTAIVEKSEEASKNFIKFLALILGREKVMELAQINKGLEKWVPYLKDILIMKLKFGGERAEFIATDLLSEFNDRLKAVREGRFDFGPVGSGDTPDFVDASTTSGNTRGANGIAIALIEMAKYPELAILTDGLKKKEDKVKFLHHFENIAVENIPGHVAALAEMKDEAFKSFVDSIEPKKKDVIAGIGETIWKKIQNLHKNDGMINGTKRTGTESAFMGFNFAKSLFS